MRKATLFGLIPASNRFARSLRRSQKLLKLILLLDDYSVLRVYWICPVRWECYFFFDLDLAALPFVDLVAFLTARHPHVWHIDKPLKKMLAFSILLTGFRISYLVPATLSYYILAARSQPEMDYIFSVCVAGLSSLPIKQTGPIPSWSG